jgi:alpha-ketoglutarate-dependent taurine dioxygenase
LAILFEHVKDPALHVRLYWDEATLAIWEERVTQHCAAAGHEGRRVLRRVTVQGDEPR